MRRTKNMSKLHDLPRFRDVVKNAGATIRSHGGNVSSIKIKWDLNQLSKRDQIFKLEVGDCTAYIDYQEFMHYARAMSTAIDENG